MIPHKIRGIVASGLCDTLSASPGYMIPHKIHGIVASGFCVVPLQNKCIRISGLYDTPPGPATHGANTIWTLFCEGSIGASGLCDTPAEKCIGISGLYDTLTKYMGSSPQGFVIPLQKRCIGISGLYDTPQNTWDRRLRAL